MKKLLGISLIAVLAVSPMMAGAANITTDIEPAADANGPVAAAAPKYALQSEVAADSTSLATAKYVKGAYNAAIKAINTVDTNAKAREGDLSSLTTTTKTDLVSAINEVKSAASSAYQLKEDSDVAADGNYISSGTGVAANLVALDSQAKANADAIATEQTRAEEQEAALSAAISAEQSRAEGVEGTLSSLTTDSKANLVSAINEVDAHADAASAAVSAEESRATAAEEALGSRIDSITSDYATKTGVVATIDSLTYTTALTSSTVTGNVPAMLEWGDTSAASIDLASGVVSSATLTTNASAASYVAGE